MESCMRTGGDGNANDTGMATGHGERDGGGLDEAKGHEGNGKNEGRRGICPICLDIPLPGLKFKE